MGRIGQKIARKLHGFGVGIIAYDPYIKVHCRTRGSSSPRSTTS